MSPLFNKWNAKIANLVSAKGEALQVGRTRLKIIRMISLILFVLVITRLGDWTLLQTPQEPTQEYNYTKDQAIIGRADIVDRNGVILATTLQVASLYADPKLIENKAFIARQLNNILKINDAEDKLNKQGRFIWVKRGITPDEHYKINALGSPGLGFRTETRRFYPQGDNTSHIVGYTSVDGNGLAGMELQYNAQLQQATDPLVLNLDIRIQHALVKSLKEKMHQFHAKAASGGVVDIQTGEILAAVSLPDFDPHHAGMAKDNERFNNFTLGVYEMGSTFKLFSTAAYLEETHKPFSTSFDASKPLKEGRFVINDYHAEKRVLTLPEVFIHSSNIGSALMGQEIGTKTLQKYYKDLGLLDKVNIDFPATGKPIIPNPWRSLNTLTASYGHGIAVSPLHVLQAAVAITDGGTMPQLSFAKQPKPKDVVEKRILSAATAHKMRQLLRLNVTDGSGKQAEVNGYYVGGKTGTSEKVSAKGGYDEHRLLSSFIAVFPADAPRYAVLAILDEPKGTKSTYGYATGGWTAAPVVADVIGDMTRILAIPVQSTPSNLTAGLAQYMRPTDQSGYSPASYHP